VFPSSNLVLYFQILPEKDSVAKVEVPELITMASVTTNPLLVKDPKTGFRPTEFYARCMLGGVAACGVTHAAVVTLDVAKVRTQAHSKAGKWPSGLIPSVKKTWQLEGLAGM
jgi:hypothetical protein